MAYPKRPISVDRSFMEPEDKSQMSALSKPEETLLTQDEVLRFHWATYWILDTYQLTKGSWMLSSGLSSSIIGALVERGKTAISQADISKAATGLGLTLDQFRSCAHFDEFTPEHQAVIETAIALKLKQRQLKRVSGYPNKREPYVAPFRSLR
jgi:hypothetical protein